jgi:hypothetical protein
MPHAKGDHNLLMDTYKHRYLELKAKWDSYYDLQQRQKKNRRVILLCSCVLCLIIGFMAGMMLFSPKGHALVSVEVPKSQTLIYTNPMRLIRITILYNDHEFVAEYRESAMSTFRGFGESEALAAQDLLATLASMPPLRVPEIRLRS